MYGMVNNAFRAYVIDKHGDAAWTDIVGKAELEVGEFSTMSAYEDAVTLSIVGAMVQQSGQGIDTVLRDVGRYWVTFAKTTPFGNLLAMAGGDFAAVIANLDDMHARIQASLPNMRPPGFACRLGDDGLLEVTYHSERESLFPFVLGVFEGLASHFNQALEVVEFDVLSTSSAKWSLRCTTVKEEAA